MPEKCPNRVISGPYFPAFELISVFSPNTGKYGPVITRIWALFTQCCCLLDYPYFKDHYKMISIDLSKRQELDADRKAIQKIYFIGNIARDGKKIKQFFALLKKQNKPF